MSGYDVRIRLFASPASIERGLPREALLTPPRLYGNQFFATLLKQSLIRTGRHASVMVRHGKSTWKGLIQFHTARSAGAFSAALRPPGGKATRMNAVAAAFPDPTPGAIYAPDGAIIPATSYVRESVLIGSQATPKRAKTSGVIPFSRSTFRRMVREGRFPAPVKLGDRVNAWRASDVAAWLASRGA